MDGTLKRLAGRLERLGMVVAPFGDFVSVRLPLLCRVHVSVAGGRLRAEAYTGTVTRTRGTLMVFILFALLVGNAFRQHGITAEGMTMGFLAVLAMGWEVIRYVLTESCITRIHAAVLADPSLLDAADAAPRGALGEGPMAEVHAGAPERDASHAR